MRYFIGLACVMMLISTVQAEEVVFEKEKGSISVGTGIMRGHTTYQIGGWVETPTDSGTVRFPLSELIFPLDVSIVRLDGAFRPNNKLKIKGGLKTNISSDAGKMKDSDWGILYSQGNGWYDPDSLDIYSESDTEADVWIFDIAARYYFHQENYRSYGVSFYAGGLYVYQNFDFTIRNLDQWYPSLNEYYGEDQGHDRISGKVLTYEVTKHIPAMIIGAEIYSRHKFNLDGFLGFAPYIAVTDRDDHILRDKVSKAECDGYAFLLSLEGSYNFNARWSVDLKYDYTFVDTEGEEKQYDDGDYAATIDQKNFSDIHTLVIGVSWLF